MANNAIIGKITLLILALSCSHSIFAEQLTSERTWIAGEYLHWWPNDSKMNVPLVTQNNNPTSFGRIGEPGTRIVIGSGSNQDSFVYGGTGGGKLRIGTWVDQEKQYGIELSGFQLVESKKTLRASSINNEVPIQNIPFIVTETTTACAANTECVLVNKSPNSATVSNQFTMQSLELNALLHLNHESALQTILIIGLRYLDLQEQFTLNDGLINQPPTVVNVFDKFTTNNHFLGLKIGGKKQLSYYWLLFDMSASVAVGVNHQKLIVRGETNLNGTQVLQNFGAFSQPSNLGVHRKKIISVVPEVNLKISYQLRQQIKLFLGYHFLYINNMIRAPHQIDRNINLSQNPLIEGTGTLTGAPAPLPNFTGTSLRLHGLGAGFEMVI